MNIKKNDGITLIALIVTIIVLLILAAITIPVIVGRNGIIDRANVAKEERKKAEYLEELRIIGLGLQPDRKLEEWNNQEYMDRYQDDIKKDPMFEEVKDNVIQLPDTEKITIQVTTKEGYVYWITEDKVEYRGKLGEDVPPDLDLKKGNIEFIAVPSEWTNTDVQVEIKTKIEGYILQYSLDGESWQEYKEPIIMEENGPIYARLINDLKETGGYATGNIKNIDRELPTVEIETNGGNYTVLADNTTVDVSITLTATDTGGSELNVLEYQLTSQETLPADDDTNWKPFINGEQITEQLAGGTYYLYTKVTDFAGNRAIQIENPEPYNINHQIRYDANGGTGAPEAQEKIMGTDLTLDAQAPTRDYYHFMGWSTSSEETTPMYQPGDIYNQDVAITLYAVWEGNQYNISLDGQSATVAGTNQLYENYARGVYLDAEGKQEITTTGITIPKRAYTVTYNCNGGSGATSATANYTFGGYYTQTNGGGTQMIDNAGKMTSSFTNTSYLNDATLYAKWTGGAVTLPTPSRANYTFNGWYTAASGGTKIGNAGASYTAPANTTVYAQWTANPSVKITTNPTAATVVAGNSVRFTMAASGVGTVTYQWYYKTSSTGAGTAISGATSTSYPLNPSTGWNGRYLYCVATSTVGNRKATATTSSVLLTVQPAYYSTVKSGVTTYYNNLATAHAGAVSGAAATAGGTITVLANVTDTSSVAISKTITLNMNGKTITRSAAITSASTAANITLTGSGTISSSVRVFEFTSGGTITLSGPTLTSTQYAAIATAGTFRLNSGTVTAKTNALISTGSTVIAGGTMGHISGSTSNGYIVATRNSGSLTMSAGTITTATSYAIVIESSTASANITGGTITSTMAISGVSNMAIWNKGTLTIGSASAAISTTNPIISGTGGYGVLNEGTLNFYNGAIQGKSGPWNGGTIRYRSGGRLRQVQSGSYKKAYYQ